MMTKLKPTLIAVAVAMLIAPLFTLGAQEAPKPAEKQAETKPVLLTPQEIKLWQAWMHGDLKGVYVTAQEILENVGEVNADLESVAQLQARAAAELGWYEAHARDLNNLLELRRGDWTEGYLRWLRVQALKHLGRTGDIQPEIEQLGMLTEWWVCGPFPNDRGQGFEDVQEPEREVSLDRDYTGKDGQTVRFRKLPAKLLDGTIELGAMMRPNEEATAFLLTAIHCEENAIAPILSASDESLKLWRLHTTLEDDDFEPIESDHPISDPLLKTDDEHPAGFDQAGTDYLELAAGWNVILVKAGNSDTDWRVRLRLSERGGWRVAQTEEELRDALANPNPLSFGAGFRDRLVGPEHPHREAYRELLLEEKDSASSYAKRKAEEALKLFEQQIAERPQEEAGQHNVERAALEYIAAWANRSAAKYSSGREENRRRELLAECVKHDPRAARALLELSQYYTTTFSNPTLAHEYAARAVEANPDWIEARLYASRVVLMKGLDVEVERELAKLLQEFPDDVGVLRFAAYYAGLRRDYKLSNELFEKALAADFADDYARDRLVERAAAANDLKTAFRLVKDARRLDPFDTDSALLMSELFLNTEQYSLAQRELDQALKIAPRDDELLFRLGQVYTAWADSSDGEQSDNLRARALQAYNDALEANPNREDIERYLQYLEGEQPPFEAALQEDITPLIEEALEQPVDDDNPYEVVYRDEIVLVNEDGTTSQYIQEAYRITNDNGREWLQRISVPAYSDQAGRCVEARVFRADGYIEEGRRSQFSATFPPLEIGDIVHVRFRVTDREQSFFGDFYGTRKVLQDYVPVHNVRYAWVLPPGRDYYTYTTGDAPAVNKVEVNGRRVWSVSASGLSKLHDEPLAPPAHQRGDTVQISTYQNWKDFGRWYYNLIKKQMEPTPEMTAEVMRITKRLTTEKEKATAVYNWVVTQVRYNADWHFGVHGYKPFSAGAVFARCIGDCKDKAILICTMLRIAGVDAYPVIINLEAFRGAEDITLPMPAHFNHAIAYIEYSDGSGQFVDGTATYNGIDELPGADRGANVIVVRPEGGEKVRIPQGEPGADTQTDEIDVEFAAGGTLKLKVKRTARGDTASILRARYETAGDRKKKLELEWSEFYPGATVSDVKVNDLLDLDVEPVIEFSVELPNAYKQKQGSIEFRTALDPREWTQTEFAALTNRKTALLMPAPFERISIARYKLPQGYKLANKPGDLELEHPNADMQITLSEKDGTLTVRRYYTLKGDPLAPADYPEFRRKLIRFDDTESATIRLKK